MVSTSPAVSPPRSPVPTVLRSPPPPEAPKEGAISRLLITPLTFLSFLLSLALVDARNHNLRAHSHSSDHPEPSGTSGRIKSFLHSLVYKPVSDSPYSYVKSLNAKEKRDASGKLIEGKEEWYWHTKQRKLMKAEISDAFQMRKWVVVVLVAFGIGAAVFSALLANWVLYLWRNW